MGNHSNDDLFQRTYASTVVFNAPDPVADYCQSTSPPKTLGHSQASVAQSPVGSLLLFLVSWCTQGFVCAFQVSVSPGLWEFCNQIPLAFKVKVPGVLSPFAGSPGWQIYFRP